MTFALRAETIDLEADLPNGVTEAIASWHRILASSAAKTILPNFKRAALELCGLAKKNGHPTVQDAVREALFEIGAIAGFDDERTRTLIAEATAPITTQETEPEGPIPLIAELGESAPFPVDALGPILAPAAEAIASKVQAPVEIAAQSVLAAAALVAQPFADIQMLFGQTRPLSLFHITIASSGDRKTSVDAEALWPIRKREAVLADEYDQALPIWKIDVSAWSSERKKIEADKKLSYDQRKVSLERLGAEPLPPLFPMLTAPNPTIEGLVKGWIHAPASLGLFSAEGGQFVGGHGMGQDHKLKTSAGLSELWDGRETRRLRAGDGLTKLVGGLAPTSCCNPPLRMRSFRIRCCVTRACCLAR